MKLAVIFPGQGSQFPGMASDLLEYPEAQEIFAKAESILGYPITKTMFSGTEEDLKATKITQPAIFIHSVAHFHVLSKTTGFKAQMMAGHSLGEFSALCCAGVLSFEDCLELVILRAQAMQEACEEQSSTMSAVLGLEDRIVEQICAENFANKVVCANYNSPGQVVISGEFSSIQEATEVLKQAGAKRIVPLAVSGAFHSPLMHSAKLRLQKAVDKLKFANAEVPIYQNFTAEPSMDAEILKRNIIEQITGPVRWVQTIRAMLESGVTHFCEIGPGKVLSALVKKIALEPKTMEIVIVDPKNLSNI